MRALIVSVGALLLAAALLHIANGMTYTLTSLRLAGDGVSASIQGLVGSFYFAGFLVGPFAAVRAIRLVGHIRTYCVFAAVICVGVLSMALVGDPFAWAASRFFMGLSLVGLLTVTESWLNERADVAYRGQLLALYFIVMYAAQAGGALFAGELNPWTFQPFVIAAILFALCLAPIALTRVESPTPPEATGFSIAKLFRISPLAVIGAVACGVLQSAAYTVAPAYVLASGFEAGDVVAGFQAAVIAGSVLLSWPLGKLSDVIDRRSVLIGTALGCGAVSVALALEAAGGSSAALYALGAAYGGTAIGLYGLAAAHANDWLEPWERVGANAGLLILFGVGAAIGPQALGLIMDAFGANALFQTAALICLVVALYGVWRSFRRAATPNEDQAPFVAQARTTFVAAELDPVYEPDRQYSFDFDGDGYGDFDDRPPHRHREDDSLEAPPA